MTTTSHSYATYKPSSVPWLGDVPEHWEMWRGKAILRPVDVRSETGDEELLTVSAQRGVVPRDSANVTMFKAESYVGYKLCWPGDLVINSLWAWAHGLGVSGHHGIVSSAYGVYRPLPGVDPQFIHLLVRSVPFQWELQVRSKGIWVSRLQLTDEAFLGAPFPLPPRPEQAAIVRYLDHADRRIQRYLSAKRKLIALLEEEKQAVVNQAVTRGLDPNVRFKPSGVEWLGDVPEHWEVRRLSQVAGILRGKFTHRPRNDPSLYDGPYPFIQTGDVAGASKMIMRYKQTLNEQGLAVSTMFPRGTLVMTIAANIGDVAILSFDACFPDSVVGFVPSKNVYRDHLHYLFRAMKREFLREAPVNTQGNLNVDRIGSRIVAIPPLREQADIVKCLDRAIADTDAAIGRARRQIELVEEYRIRLVADVVTGKLNVREAAAQLPEEAEDRNLIEECGPLSDSLDEEIYDAEEEPAIAEEVRI